MVRASLGLALAVFLAPSAAAAQPVRSPRMFVAARVGANLVGNTYRFTQEKATTGAGVSGGVFVARNWVAEFEGWFRAASPVCCSGREQLFSLTAERLYAGGGIQPYLAGGLALLHTQGSGQAARSNSYLQIQVTAGVRVPIAGRLALDLDLRGNGGGSTMIVRPTVGAVYLF